MGKELVLRPDILNQLENADNFTIFREQKQSTFHYLIENNWFSKFADKAFPTNGHFVARVYRCETFGEVLASQDDDYNFSNGFYFCDDPRTWASPWMSDEAIAHWEIEFFNPLYIAELPPQVMFEKLVSRPMFKEYLDDHGYDVVLYQGDDSGMTGRVKQGVVFESDFYFSPKRIINYAFCCKLEDMQESTLSVIDLDSIDNLKGVIAEWFWHSDIGVPFVINSRRILELLGESNARAIEAMFSNIRTEDLVLIRVAPRTTGLKLKYHSASGLLIVTVNTHMHYPFKIAGEHQPDILEHDPNSKIMIKGYTDHEDIYAKTIRGIFTEESAKTKSPHLSPTAEWLYGTF